jgi:hypothetical protein
MFFGEYSAMYEKHSGCSAPRPTPGEKAKDEKPVVARVEADARHRRQGGDDRRQSEQQQIELIDRLAAEPVGELALTERADEEAGHRDAPDPGDLASGDKPTLHQVRNQRAKDREIQHVEEQT